MAGIQDHKILMYEGTGSVCKFNKGAASLKSWHTWTYIHARMINCLIFPKHIVVKIWLQNVSDNKYLNKALPGILSQVEAETK